MFYDKIELLGYTVTEPSVAITNLILASFCIYWASKLKTLAAQNEEVMYWRWFFFAMGAATFVGAFDHTTRFYPHIFGTFFSKITWISGALSVFFAEKSAIVLLKSEKWKKIISYLVILQFFLFIVVLFYDHHFRWVNLNIGIGILGVLGSIHAYFYMKQRRMASRLIWIGIFAVPIIFLIRTTKLHIWLFNYDDLAHFCLMGIFYLFFLAAKGKRLIAKN